ncbi:hypothetical protein HNY42_16020 (plasmid) [Exiguobacterium sp. Helios]|uniref:hypothetical protein n=1 Tax=Exiguobacterium sp. Helios TaxID=2735868 RepID=UPI00165E7750|nr:hypothetical protein [Exiguobacterium sp. Helios]QNR22505.1 hypothetical protein HNY42_16020 [Exiguobacterium sp. Helios]
MIKLVYSEEIEIRHHEFLIQNLVPKLTKAKSITFPWKKKSVNVLIEHLKYEGTNLEFKTAFKRQQLSFYSYIESNLERISKGKPSELLKIQEEMSSLFPLIMNILSSREQDATFSDHVYQLFGYEAFKTDTLFNLLKTAAKRRSGRGSRTRFGLKNRHHFRELLCEAFPSRAQEICDALNDDKLPTSKMFEKAFYTIPDIHMTLSNVGKSRIFEYGWSDYALIMVGGVIVCPYCNRQFVTPFLSSDGRIRADFDHFLSKSAYPHFSMSLYNLVPSCKQCNQGLKGGKNLSPVGLHPFEHDMHSYFRFTAMPGTVTSTASIDIEVDDPAISNIEELIDTFKLRPLYGYHNGHAHEIVKKRQMYPDDLLHRLLPESPFSDVEELKSFIVGYVVDESRINEEPLSKLRRDIAIQVGFLPKKIKLDASLMNKLKQVIK